MSQPSYSFYRCAILSTSTGSLDHVIDRDSPIQILRLSITTGEETYQDGLNFKPDDFYRWLASHPDEVPVTTPPSREEVLATFQFLKSQGYHEAIVITIGSRLSQSSEVVRSVANEVEGLKVHIVDTGSVGMPEGFCALEALRLLKEGKTAEEVVAYLERLKPNCEVIFSLFSLKQLTNSGMLSRLTGSFADWAGLKTMFRFRHNKLERLDVARSEEQLIEDTVHTITKRLDGVDMNKILISGMYGGNHELYQKFANRLHSQTGLHLKGIPISPVVSAYIGSDAFGVGIVEKV